LRIVREEGGEDIGTSRGVPRVEGYAVWRQRQKARVGCKRGIGMGDGHDHDASAGMRGSTSNAAGDSPGAEGETGTRNPPCAEGGPHFHTTELSSTPYSIRIARRTSLTKMRPSPRSPVCASVFNTWITSSTY